MERALSSKLVLLPFSRLLLAWLAFRKFAETILPRLYCRKPTSPISALSQKWLRLSKQLSRFLKWKLGRIQIRRGASENSFRHLIIEARMRTVSVALLEGRPTSRSRYRRPSNTRARTSPCASAARRPRCRSAIHTELGPAFEASKAVQLALFACSAN